MKVCRLAVRGRVRLFIDCPGFNIAVERRIKDYNLPLKEVKILMKKELKTRSQLYLN